ncbi:efflux RND transporter periplasmic adaptor subunit [candidate division KSB1 bacterium]|nr:efflux RND transporter periplasmic adaptor subunit [candidate division KSB1 bacterium]
MRTKNLPFIFDILLASLSFSMVSCGEGSADQAKVRPVAVRVVKPVVAEMQNRLSYMGTVHADREVKVIAQVQGTVSSLPKPEGTSVNKGDLVAEIAVPDLQATVERLQADLDYWQQRYQADKILVEAEALPSEQMEASLRAYRSAKAALAEAEAKLAKAQEFSSIKGKMLSWLVEPGQHVMPGQPILLLGNHQLEIHVEVVEEDVRRGVRVGVPVNVQDWRGQIFQSEVSEVAPVATGPARTFTVKMPAPTFSNQVEGLLVGASMQVDFILKSSGDGMTVPVEAISRRGGNPHIFLIRENSAKKQPVTTGIEQDGWIEVAFPWNQKDPVAISNLNNLRDGVPVFPAEIKEGSP